MLFFPIIFMAMFRARNLPLVSLTREWMSLTSPIVKREKDFTTPEKTPRSSPSFTVPFSLLAS